MLTRIIRTLNVRSILPALLPLVLASSVFAADHAADAHDGAEKAGALPTTAQGIVPMIVSFVVFGVTFAILAVKVWPQIVKGLKDREDKIRTEIESAELAQQQAKSALAQYEKNLAQARAEAQKMLDDTKAQQTALAADLKAKADVELSAMREKAKADIDLAKRSAISEIYAEASGLATTMAGKILKREINASDQATIVEESLAEMRSLARAN